MSYNNVGKVWTVESFKDLLNKTKCPSWVNSVTLHHTASPSLIQRPQGFTVQHIINMRDFYKRKGWRSGPHFFTDDDQIWGMTPINEKGVHAISFNSNSIGIEVLGDYDSEDPFNSRGSDCWYMAIEATKELLKWIGVPANDSTVHFHRDDPRTSKTCPGDKITKKWVLDLITKDIPAPEQKACRCPIVVENKPAIEWIVKNKGYTEKEALKLFSKKNGYFFFGDDWLEGAFYDKKTQTTMCSVEELEAIRHK